MAPIHFINKNVKKEGLGNKYTENKKEDKTEARGFGSSGDDSEGYGSSDSEVENSGGKNLDDNTAGMDDDESFNPRRGGLGQPK